MDDPLLKLLFLLLAGPALIAGGVYAHRHERRLRRRAQRTDGVVTGSDTFAESGSWRPVVQYAYTVGGVAYSNDRVFPPPGRTGGKGTWARRIVDHYPPGTRVTVYYQPDDPQTAYLIDKGSWLWLIPMGLGALLVVLALGPEGWRQT